MRYGLIAGNGRFPILALEEARRQGHEIVVVALREEAAPEVEAAAWRCHWISIGELGKLIKILKAEGITQIMMAGQVKHASIFSSIRPDLRHRPTSPVRYRRAPGRPPNGSGTNRAAVMPGAPW